MSEKIFQVQKDPFKSSIIKIEDIGDDQIEVCFLGGVNQKILNPNLFKNGLNHANLKCQLVVKSITWT